MRFEGDEDERARNGEVIQELTPMNRLSVPVPLRPCDGEDAAN